MATWCSSWLTSQRAELRKANEALKFLGKPLRIGDLRNILRSTAAALAG